MELNSLTYLAIALFLGLFSSKLMKRLKLPNVTGYLIVGLLVGPYCIGIIPKEIVTQF